MQEQLIQKKKINNGQLSSDYERIKHIYEEAVEVTPFNKVSDTIHWKKINLDALDSLEKFGTRWDGRHYFRLAYRTYGGLIVGKDKAIDEYYIGIRDLYDEKSKRVLEYDKVEKFQFCDEEHKEPNYFGYWIMRVH